MSDESGPADAGDDIDLAREPDFRLGYLEVTPSTREVSTQSGRITIEPRVMQVLVCLWRHHGQVVSRDQLIRRCWSGRVVGDDAINRCIAKVRQIAEGSPVAGAFTVETIPRVGYRLKVHPASPVGSLPSTQPSLSSPPPAAVTAPAVSPPAPVGAPPVWSTNSILARPALERLPRRIAAAGTLTALILAALLGWRLIEPSTAPLPAVSSIAVLPLQNLTDEPRLDPVADKLTADVTDLLDRGGDRYIAPWAATMAWKGKPFDASAVGKQLGVRNVVTGSLRKSDAGYGVEFEIVDAPTGNILHAQDVAIPAPSGTVPEEALALAVFEPIGMTVEQRWIAYQLSRPPDDNDPQNVAARLEALVIGHRQEDVTRMERLVRIGRSVMPKAPAFVSGFEADVCWHYLAVIQTFRQAAYRQRSAWADDALEAARRAEIARPEATSPHACRSETFTELERWDDALAEAQYVIDNHPLTAVGYEARAGAEFGLGQFREALADFAELCRRDPEPAESLLCYASIGESHLFLGENAAAAAAFRALDAEDPKSSLSQFLLAAALELSGDHHGAISAAARYRALKTNDDAWRVLDMSDEPVFVAHAKPIRAALGNAGLFEPSFARTAQRG